MMSGETSAGQAKAEAVVPIKEKEPQEEEANINVVNIFDQVDDYYFYISIFY